MAGIWTDNWRAFRNIMLMGCHYNGFSTVRNTSGNIVSDYVTYTTTALSPMGKYSRENMPGNSYYSTGLLVGTGDSPPAATDYKLANDAEVTYLSAIAADPTFDTATGVMTREIALSVQNQTANNITIKEWGIFSSIRYIYSASSTSIGTCLLYREVLANPVTLAPLQAATLTLTMTLTLTDIL